MTSVARTEVLVVGAGPTGLAAANVLGSLGVATLVVERAREVASEPRAVSIDDEAVRLLQTVDLLDRATGIVMPGTGTRYYGARGRPLAYARGPRVPRLGHPIKNPIDHGEFSLLLLEGAERYPSVNLVFEREVVGVDQAIGEPAVVRLRPAEGEAYTVHADYVLACDGGRSSVRRLLGIEMTGSSFEEPWLVIDTIADPHVERYAMHHGDPRRPHVIVPGRDGRCRYEFMLLPGESAEDAASFEMARSLLAGYRPELAPEHVIRQRVYVFHALVADRWRDGRVLLLGDAAHMMPPFAAQGLNSGLRDAANAAWKVACVLREQATDGLLATYETERRPHTEAMIRLSVRFGGVMMTRSRGQARARDVAFIAIDRIRPLQRFFRELRFKPQARCDDGFVVRNASEPQDLTGRMLPQARVMFPDGQTRLLDTVLGTWFALVAVQPMGDALGSLRSPVWDDLGVRRVELTLEDRFPARRPLHSSVADMDGALAAELEAHRERLLLVRPDRFVAGGFALDEEETFARALLSVLRSEHWEPRGQRAVFA